MGFLDRAREERSRKREAAERESDAMKSEIDLLLERAVTEAEAGNIEAEETLLAAANQRALLHDSSAHGGSRYFDERISQLVAAGAIRRAELLGFAGEVYMWRDRVVMLDQGRDVRRMDGDVRASVETAGELVSSKRPTLTRMMVGAVLPGTALIPGLALQKQSVQDTRALFFVLEHPEWGRMVQVAPGYEGAMRQVAQAVNQAAREAGHRKSVEAATAVGRGSALEALKKLGELRDADVLTQVEFEEKKLKLLEEL